MAVLGGKREQHAFLFRDEAGCQENVMAGYDRRRMPEARDRRAPDDILQPLFIRLRIFRDAPLEREVLFPRAAVQARPAPGGPILRAHETGAKKNHRHHKKSIHCKKTPRWEALAGSSRAG